MISLHEMLAGFLGESGVDRQTAGLVAGKVIRRAGAGAALTDEELALAKEFLAKVALGPQPEPPDLPAFRRSVERSEEGAMAFRPGHIRPPKTGGGHLPAGKPIPAFKSRPGSKPISGSPGEASPAWIRQLAHSIAKRPG
jgi:hypothetical protein